MADIAYTILVFLSIAIPFSSVLFRIARLQNVTSQKAWLYALFFAAVTAVIYVAGGLFLLVLFPGKDGLAGVLGFSILFFLPILVFGELIIGTLIFRSALKLQTQSERRSWALKSAFLFSIILTILLLFSVKQKLGHMADYPKPGEANEKLCIFSNFPDLCRDRTYSGIGTLKSCRKIKEIETKITCLASAAKKYGPKACFEIENIPKQSGFKYVHELTASGSVMTYKQFKLSASKESIAIKLAKCYRNTGLSLERLQFCKNNSNKKNNVLVLLARCDCYPEFKANNMRDLEIAKKAFEQITKSQRATYQEFLSPIEQFSKFGENCDQ